MRRCAEPASAPCPSPCWTRQCAAIQFARQLDPGEAECLSVALSRNCRFLSDDFAARRTAELKGLAVSGTLGVLARLIDAGLLSLAEADDLLAQMIDHGYRSPVRSLESIGANW